MKQVNFIKTLSPAQQHELSSWYHLSVLATCLICISIVICQSVQLYTSRQLKNNARYWLSKQASMHQALDKKNELIQKTKVLEEKLFRLKTASRVERLSQAFNTYLEALSKIVFLQSLSVRHDHALCTITCNKPLNAIKFTDKLRQSGLFSSVKLIQLKSSSNQTANMVQATIKADLHIKETFPMIEPKKTHATT